MSHVVKLTPEQAFKEINDLPDSSISGHSIYDIRVVLKIKREVSRKFAVISKPKNVCLSAETKK